jgi:biopolymer transport protein TolR
MGASAGGAKAINARRGRRGSRHGAISEINVTPLVDVMLVLLIVFMVAAPLMTVGVPIELPKTAAKSMNTQTEPLFISVQQDGKVFLMETEISLDDLTSKLQALAKNGNEEQLFVRADTATQYGKVMEVMGQLNSAGYKKIGLVTTTEDVVPPAN